MVRDARLRGLLTMRVSLAVLICRRGKSNPAFGLRQINPTGKSLLIFRNHVKPRNQKYFYFRPTQIRCISLAIPSLRGALRNVINAGRDAVDAVSALDETC